MFTFTSNILIILHQEDRAWHTGGAQLILLMSGQMIIIKLHSQILFQLHNSASMMYIYKSASILSATSNNFYMNIQLYDFFKKSLDPQLLKPTGKEYDSNIN